MSVMIARIFIFSFLHLALLPASTLISSEEDEELRGNQMRLLKQTVQTGQDFSKAPPLGELHELSLAETTTQASRKPNVSTSLLSASESLQQKSRPFNLNLMQIGLLTVDIPFEITALGASLLSMISPSSVTTMGDLVLTGTVTLTRGMLIFSLLKPQDARLQVLSVVPVSFSLLNCLMSACNYTVEGALLPFPFLMQCVFIFPTIASLYTLISLQNYTETEYETCLTDHGCTE